MSLTLCSRCQFANSADARTCQGCGFPLGQGEPGQVTELLAPSQERGPQQPDSGRDRLRGRLQALTEGRFRIEGRLGLGGMAAVYLASDLNLGRKVAIKVLLHGVSLEPGMRDRFRREGQAIAMLDHRNIVQVFHVEHHDDLSFYVLEYVRGGSLGDVMEREEGMPVEAVCGWFAQLADALDYAHAKGIVHRDLKPANVLLDPDGNAKLTDFGIARVEGRAKQTATGLLVGTAAYMSPEQWNAQEITAASDQYSLGILLYEMLGGRPPFEGSALSLLRMHAETTPPPISEVRPDCPKALARVIRRMLEKDPARRWPTLESAAVAAGAFHPTDGVVVKPSVKGPERGRSQRTDRTPSRVTAAIRSHPRASAGMGVVLFAVPLTVWGLPEVMSSMTSTRPTTELAEIEGPESVVLMDSIADSLETPMETEPVPVREDRPPSPVRIDGVPEGFSLEIGQRRALTARVLDARGGVLSGTPVSWRSNRPEVVEVDAGSDPPEAIARATGSAVLSVSAGSISTTVDVEVEVGQPSVEIAVDPPFLRLAERATAQLTATVIGGSPGEATVQWTSRVPEVATVDEMGRVTAGQAGQTEIRVVAGGAVRTIEVTVEPAVVPISVADLSTRLSFDAAEELLMGSISFTAVGTVGSPWCAEVEVSRDGVLAETRLIPIDPAAGSSEHSYSISIDQGPLSRQRPRETARMTPQVTLWSQQCPHRTNQEPLGQVTGNDVCLVGRSIGGWVVEDCGR